MAPFSPSCCAIGRFQMEPVSMVASVFTLVAAVGRVGQGLEKVCCLVRYFEAPGELASLTNEVRTITSDWESATCLMRKSRFPNGRFYSMALEMPPAAWTRTPGRSLGSSAAATMSEKSRIVPKNISTSLTRLLSTNYEVVRAWTRMGNLMSLDCCCAASSES